MLSRQARIGARLRLFREARGLSQLALAKLSGVGQGWISAIEAGRVRNPGILTLARLARVLEVSVARFIEGPEPGKGETRAKEQA